MLRCVATDSFCSPARRWAAHVQVCQARRVPASLDDADFQCPWRFGLAGEAVDNAHISWDCSCIDVSDPVAVLTTLFNGGAPLPAPYPDAGEDPTADPMNCASRV